MTRISVLHFVTSNPHKAVEVRDLLGADVRRADLPITEIQASSVEEIVRAKLDVARKRIDPPLAVEDVSLEISALGGFPGPYIKWLIETAGGDGLAAIVSGLSCRSAKARCVVGIWDGTRVRFFEGKVEGEIVTSARGSTEFGWDAWFLPRDSERTYGEMSLEEKSEWSHRARAWRSVKKEFLESGHFIRDARR